MKASFPADPRLFFCVLRTLAELRSADCRFGGLCESYAVFAAAKTSGRVRRCGGAIVKPARFAEALRRPPVGATTQAVGRPGRLCRPERAKRAEKESGDHRGELARIRGIRSLFRIACRNNPTKDCLSGELERGFGLQSRLSNVPRYSLLISSTGTVVASPPAM